MKDEVIVVRDLKKCFKIYPDKSNSIKEKILFFKRNQYEKHWVLKGVDFTIKRGEAVGLIGKNGCGKSTTLKLLNRIIYPTSGSVKVNGKVSSLIELGAGFHPDMTGRENIYINASIFGMTKKQIDEKIDDIIAFSELEDAVEQPVRTYSSGMYMRLAFSVAINVEADILLIDEILAVGDVNFQKKCFQKLKEIKNQGTTIVIVSHSLGQIEQICDKCLWIENGKLRETGKPKTIHAHYLKAMEEEAQKKKAGMDEQYDEEDRNTFCGQTVVRNGSGKLYFTRAALYDRKGQQTTVFTPGEYLKVQYHFKTKAEIQNVLFALRIYKDDNTHCFGSNCRIENGECADIKGKDTFIVEFPALELLTGNYMIDVDAIAENGEIYDSIHDSVQFFVQGETERTGICNMESNWKME